MAKRAKLTVIVFSTLALVSVVYTLLMVHYRSVSPSDLSYFISGNPWEIDSVFVQRQLLIFLPDEENSLTRADTIWELTGAIFGRNNLHQFLSIKAIEIQDPPAGFTGEAPISCLSPPTPVERKSSQFFLKEPFGIVYTLQWADVRMDPHQFNRFVERAFHDSSLTIKVHTNRGNIMMKPRGYKTMNSWDLVNEYPPPKQKF